MLAGRTGNPVRGLELQQAHHLLRMQEAPLSFLEVSEPTERRDDVADGDMRAGKRRGRGRGRRTHCKRSSPPTP